jgi:hypothetical protein
MIVVSLKRGLNCVATCCNGESTYSITTPGFVTTFQQWIPWSLRIIPYSFLWCLPPVSESTLALPISLLSSTIFVEVKPMMPCMWSTKLLRHLTTILLSRKHTSTGNEQTLEPRPSFSRSPKIEYPQLTSIGMLVRHYWNLASPKPTQFYSRCAMISYGWRMWTNHKSLGDCIKWSMDMDSWSSKRIVKTTRSWLEWREYVHYLSIWRAIFWHMSHPVDRVKWFCEWANRNCHHEEMEILEADFERTIILHTRMAEVWTEMPTTALKTLGVWHMPGRR